MDFNKYLDTLLAASQPPPGSTRQNQSPWLFLDAADTLFTTAKRRVYTGKLTGAGLAKPNAVPDSLSPVLEELPKWAQLSEVLQEIEHDAYLNPVPVDESSGSILIMCGDQGTCRQLREYLQTMHEHPDEEDGPSASFMMRRKLRNYLDWKRDFTKVSASLFSENEKAINANQQQRQQPKQGRPPPNKRRRVRGNASTAAGPSRTDSGALRVAGDRDAHIAGLMAELQPAEAEALQKPEAGPDSLDNTDDFYELFGMDELVLIHPYQGDLDEHVLEEAKPRYVVMYEPDTAFIRRIEVYRSSHTDRAIKVFFLYYGGSVEEQRYLSSVRREKDAFTKLIRERGNMALTLHAATQDPQESFLRTINTRIAGGGRLTTTAEPPRVVVDVREFRSSLPSLLHGRGLAVVPCMLTVGDYVLSPHMCVERKSVRDLIASFANGRLYNQTEAMTEHYKQPMLLIEFDRNKSFTLEPFVDFSASSYSAALAGNMANPDLQAKLVMLTLAFPRLKILWSSSPFQTADMFAELKKNADEPDPARAVAIGLDPSVAQLQHGGERVFNQLSMDMLRIVPGVSDRNIMALTVRCTSLWDVANADEGELDGAIGMVGARSVWRFFNRSVFDGDVPGME